MINGTLYRLAFALSIQLYAITALAETHKFALVLGNNQGYETRATLRYAEQDARKFYRVLTELGGFLPDDTLLLLNADAARVRQALKQIEKRLFEYKQKSGDKTLLVIFFSGHAEGQSFELGSSSLTFSELASFLRSSSADVRIAFLDSCQSGQLITTKGGHRGAAFKIRVTDEITSKGYAMITSSAQNELSQESAELRGAYFTHYLVSALRGAGDFSGDGRV
ncbi:MAG: caspase family protein, partial [Deltaproteobacteria bacterium]|nr:caspase family protein [Deltaproteobacteria bacterium]